MGKSTEMLRSQSLTPRIDRHVVQEIGAVIRRIHGESVAALFVESERRILDGPSAGLLQSAEVKRVFLGNQST